MTPDFIRLLISKGMEQSGPVTLEQFKAMTRNTEQPSLSMLAAFADWSKSLGLIKADEVGFSANALMGTPAHNDYLIYMWLLTKEDKWLIALHSSLGSNVPEVASSALWASESLRQQNETFKAAWDCIPLCDVQIMYRANVHWIAPLKLQSKT